MISAAKSAGTVAARREAEFGHGILHRRCGDRGAHSGVDAGDERRRRCCRHDEAEPVGSDDLVAGLGKRRHVRQHRRARCAGGRQDADLASLVQRQVRADRNVGGDLAAEQILDRRRRALIGHMHHVESGGAGEQGANEMVAAARARRAVGGVPGVGPAPGDELRQRLDVVRHFRTDGEIEADRADARHRRKVLHRVVAERLVDIRIEHQRGGWRQDQRRAVGRARLDRIERDATGRARLVVDNQRRRIALHLIRKHARNRIERAARREADHQTRWLINRFSGHRQAALNQSGGQSRR